MLRGAGFLRGKRLSMVNDVLEAIYDLINEYLVEASSLLVTRARASTL